MRRLRLPLFLLSLTFLAASLYTLLYRDDRAGGPLLTYLHEDTPEELEARAAAIRQAQHKADLDYAARLRADGLQRLQAHDYENALVRLDEAAVVDPAGEQSEDVTGARGRIKAAYVGKTGAP